MAIFFFSSSSSSSIKLFSLLLLIFFIFFPPPSLRPYRTLHRPFMDPTSTLHSFFYFNTASWIVKLYTSPILLLFSLHHNHISIVLTPPTPPTHFYCFPVFPSPPPPPHFYNFAYFYPSIFKRDVVTLGHQSTEEGGETFSDTTHGCSFSVMFIICFMVKNGSSVLMVHGVLYYLNALVSLQL